MGYYEPSPFTKKPYFHEKWEFWLGVIAILVSAGALHLAYDANRISEEALERLREADRALRQERITVETSLIYDSIYYEPHQTEARLIIYGRPYPCGASLSAWIRVSNNGLYPITIDTAFGYFCGRLTGFKNPHTCVDGNLVRCDGVDQCEFPIVVEPYEHCRVLLTVPWVMSEYSDAILRKLIDGSGWVRSSAFAAGLDPQFSQSPIPTELKEYVPMLLASDVQVDDRHRFKRWRAPRDAHGVKFEVLLASGGTAIVTDFLSGISVGVTTAGPSYSIGADPPPFFEFTPNDTAALQTGVSE